MVNFRKFKDSTIEFYDQPLVLLSAANGIGKTTIIDAIEWCLTGDIGRLKTAFETRSTNEDERKLNTKGILKNKDSDEKSKVTVFLWLIDGTNEILICREQKNDVLDPECSTVTLNGNEKASKQFINEYIGKSFYNFHFCDIQKSFNIQSTKRCDLVSFFSDFITNYDEQKTNCSKY